MRVRSAILVSALIRRIFNEGGFAAVVHRGAEEAGAIFLQVRDRSGRLRLYGPAPQALALDEPHGAARLFELRCDAADAVGETALAELLARERRFDPDLWLVEIETDQPERYIALAEV